MRDSLYRKIMKQLNKNTLKEVQRDGIRINDKGCEYHNINLGEALKAVSKYMNENNWRREL